MVGPSDDDDDDDDDDDEAVQERQLTETMPQFLELVVDSSSGQNQCTAVLLCIAVLSLTNTVLHCCFALLFCL